MIEIKEGPGRFLEIYKCSVKSPEQLQKISVLVVYKCIWCCRTVE